LTTHLLGLDIGGTKCSAILGQLGDNGQIRVVGRETFLTAGSPDPAAMLHILLDAIRRLMGANRLVSAGIPAMGISCGGPLDSRRGIIFSPPNLPGWDRVEINSFFEDNLGIPVALQNDANACALAEWRFGAGRGTRNMIFLTFGTGMGAGLILDGKLYSGTNDNAGEVGHIRLERFGPVGYGKSGSFEGFCSGGGIARLAHQMVLEKLQMGEEVSFCDTIADLPRVDARRVAEAAMKGDPLAIRIYETCGTFLGRGLSVLVDILNPECIVLGSIFFRSGELLIPAMEKALEEEALSLALGVCRIVPAALEEKLGDLASLSVAADLYANLIQ
jgi:glucokinase